MSIMGLNFTIQFPVEPHNILNPGDKILLIGSCFTENIGLKLTKGGFQTIINPFGILYNANAIKEAVSNIIKHSMYQQVLAIYHL